MRDSTTTFLLENLQNSAKKVPGGWTYSNEDQEKDSEAMVLRTLRRLNAEKKQKKNPPKK